MNVLAGSLVYRAAMPVWRWLLAACRASLVGRFFLAVVGVVTRVASDSGSLGTRRAGSRPLESKGHPVAVLAIARPYLWLRRVVGGGPVGTVARAGWSQLAGSCLARGRWVRVLGAGLFALGCGRVVLLLARGITTVDNTGIPLAAPGARYVAPVLVLIVGGLMLLAGARLLPAVPISLTGRALGFVAGGPPRFASPDREGDDSTQAQRWLAWLVTFLAAVAGAAGGLTAGQGPEKLLLLVFALCAVVLLLVRPEALLVVVAVFPWLDWAARRVLGGAGPLWDETLLVVSVLLLLWCVIVLRRWELWTLPITLPLLLAFAVALGSVAVNDVPGDVGFYALRMLFEPMLFYFLGFLFPKDRRWVRATIIIFVAVSTSLALHGLYQYLSHAPMPASWVDVRETAIGTRAYSIIMNPNGLAAFLLMGALISMSLALARVSRLAPRLLWALACVVQLGGIAVTFSRGAWIGLAVGVLVLVIMAYRRYLVAIAGAAVLALVLRAAGLRRQVHLRLQFLAYITKSSQAGRLYVWRMAVDYAAAHPWFGIGLGTFGGTSAITFGYGRLWVDNFYLQLAAEGGLLLLAFFLWILLRAIKGLVKGHGATDGFRRALAAGMIAAFVAVAVANAHRQRVGDPHRRRRVLVSDRTGDVGHAPRTGGARRGKGLMALRVVHVIGGGDTGGAMSHLLPLLPALQRAGCDAHLLCLGEGGLADTALAGGLQVGTLPMKGAHDPRMLAELRRVLAGGRATGAGSWGPESPWDVVHTHGMRANLPVRMIVPSLRGRPCLFTTVHSDLRLDYESRALALTYSALDRASLGGVDWFLCVSDSLRRLLVERGYPADRLSTVRSGLESIGAPREDGAYVRPAGASSAWARRPG